MGAVAALTLYHWPCNMTAYDLFARLYAAMKYLCISHRSTPLLLRQRFTDYFHHLFGDKSAVFIAKNMQLDSEDTIENEDYGHLVVYYDDCKLIELIHHYGPQAIGGRTLDMVEVLLNYQVYGMLAGISPRDVFCQSWVHGALFYLGGSDVYHGH